MLACTHEPPPQLRVRSAGGNRITTPRYVPAGTSAARGSRRAWGAESEDVGKSAAKRSAASRAGRVMGSIVGSSGDGCGSKLANLARQHLHAAATWAAGILARVAMLAGENAADRPCANAHFRGRLLLGHTALEHSDNGRLINLLATVHARSLELSQAIPARLPPIEPRPQAVPKFRDCRHSRLLCSHFTAEALAPALGVLWPLQHFCSLIWHRLL